MWAVAVRMGLYWLLGALKLTEKTRSISANVLAIPVSVALVFVVGGDWRPCAFWCSGLALWAVAGVFDEEPKAEPVAIAA